MALRSILSSEPGLSKGLNGAYAIMKSYPHIALTSYRITSTCKVSRSHLANKHFDMASIAADVQQIVSQFFDRSVSGLQGDAEVEAFASKQHMMDAPVLDILHQAKSISDHEGELALPPVGSLDAAWLQP